MTNGWVDMKNTDMMLIMGGNPAENHPCGFKWALEAKRTRNAKMISVDPRFTRTSAVADMFCQIRAGTDIAFLGGFINYAIQNNRIAKDYVINYTNAAFIVRDDFKLPTDTDGVFSGFDAKAFKYNNASWNYSAGDAGGKAVHSATGAVDTAHTVPGIVPVPVGMPEKVAYDLTLQDPNCVYQLLKKHYSRYTPELIERTTGIPKEQFLKAADTFTSVRINGDMKKAATIIYAVGWTHHSFGTQIIRTAAMLQLLLGNVGRAGGGVNALRGHSNIQGATDMAGLYDTLPGYLKVPTPADTSFDGWMKRITPTASKPAPWDSFNYYSNTSKFVVSLLKAMYGDFATKENQWAFDYLPKVDRDYSWVHLWDNMYNGEVKGMFAFGMNGVAIGPDTKKNIDALKRAEFLVVGEIYPDETSEFWRSPGITQEEMKQIQTTVYRLPCAGFAEKDGSFTNSARWLLWKNAAVPTPGECRLDQAIVAQIFLKIRELYQKEGGKFPDPILNLQWKYTTPLSPSLTEVLKEMNGKALGDLEDPKTKQQIKAGQQLPGFAWLKDDGTTSCGIWIYAGAFTEAGNQTARRDPSDPSNMGVHPNWGWSWPANRRVLYNRASCDINGKPWDNTRRQVWWNEDLQKWVGNDVPDFKPDSHPKDHMGPFIMNAEGVGRIFAPLSAFADGPMPEYYEPFESPIQNLFHPEQSTNPVVTKFRTPDDKYGTPQEGFTVVCTTFRLTEHYHYWTKNNPVNVQLVPEPFVEMGVEMADEIGVRGGERVKVSSARGEYIAKAMVTKRIKPMMIDGKKTYQIGIPLHWGYRGISEDEGRTSKTLVNLLTPTIIDPNAHTPEFKGFLVKVEKA
jgi:formate dehydrogenase major subunit